MFFSARLILILQRHEICFWNRLATVPGSSSQIIYIFEGTATVDPVGVRHFKFRNEIHFSKLIPKHSKRIRLSLMKYLSILRLTMIASFNDRYLKIMVATGTGLKIDEDS